MFWVIYFAVVLGSLAMLVREGLWSNALMLCNVLMSGLVAFGFFAPLALLIDEKTDGQYTYPLDFICLWCLFVLSVVLFRLISDVLSKSRMRFKNPIDPVGGPLVGLVISWVLAAFLMASLHAAPLAKDLLGGKLLHTSSEVSSKSALFAPDLGWLRFVEKASGNNLFGTSGSSTFKAAGFVKIYADHREKFGKTPSTRVKRI